MDSLPPKGSNEAAPGSRPEDPGLESTAAAPSQPGRHRRRKRKRRSDHAPRAHATCDRLTAGLIYGLVVFTPWAFGTTQEWALWIAHAAGWALGGVLLAKWVIRWRESYSPPRWGDPPRGSGEESEAATGRLRRDPLVVLLALVTVFLLGYVALSLFNARATYDETTKAFVYLREPIPWLPRSYDRHATFLSFIQYVGLAGLFWAARDWLLTRTTADPLADSDALPGDPRGSVLIPVRLRQLLWVLCLNGALLAIVSILQRADGTNKLLWIVESRSNKPADAVFGPWSYRANAAQYFNLLWPVCLAFWLWTQEQAARAAQSQIKRFDGPQLVLLPCAIFMAACPTISGSRGGALISVGVAGVVALLLLTGRQLSLPVRWVTLAALGVAGVVSVVGGWNAALERFAQADALYRTGIATGTNDFTLLIRMPVPDRPSGAWRTVVTLTPDNRAAAAGRRVNVLVPPNGGFMAQIVGSAPTNRHDLIARNLPANLLGREAVLAVVRQKGLRLYLDGVELPTVENVAGLGAGWEGRVTTEYLKLGPSGAQEVALVGFALTPAELQAASAQPLTELPARLLTGKMTSPDLADGTNAIVLPEGVVAEIAGRPSDPGTKWLALKRAAAAGPLGFGRSLESVGIPFRGQMHVAFTVWNPAAESLFLGVGVDGAFPTVVEVPPRGEHRVQALVAIPPGTSARRLELAVAEDDLGGVEEMELGSQLYVRDLRADAGASIFARSVAGGVRIDPGTLADRMSGRPEIYENARRMAADFGFWGSGAGTFTTQYQFYRRPGQNWAAYAHDDWLETRITFGWPGLIAIGVGMAGLALRSLFGSGVAALRVVVILWWLALIGCLLHARFDFPFQIHSVLLVFCLLASGLTVLTASRKP